MPLRSPNLASHEVGVVPARGHPAEPGLERTRPVDLDADRHLRDEVADPGGVLLVGLDEENPQGWGTRRVGHSKRARGKDYPGGTVSQRRVGCGYERACGATAESAVDDVLRPAPSTRIEKTT